MLKLFLFSMCILCTKRTSNVPVIFFTGIVVSFWALGTSTLWHTTTAENFDKCILCTKWTSNVAVIFFTGIVVSFWALGTSTLWHTTTAENFDKCILCTKWTSNVAVIFFTGIVVSFWALGTLTRLPIAIGWGRYNLTPRNQRLCLFCEVSIGDEFHSLMKCAQAHRTFNNGGLPKEKWNCFDNLL